MNALKVKTVHGTAYVDFPDGTRLRIFPFNSNNGKRRYDVRFLEEGSHVFTEQELINLCDNGLIHNFDTEICSNYGGEVNPLTYEVLEVIVNEAKGYQYAEVNQ